MPRDPIRNRTRANRLLIDPVVAPLGSLIKFLVNGQNISADRDINDILRLVN
jgi:hypothetical protein